MWHITPIHQYAVLARRMATVDAESSWNVMAQGDAGRGSEGGGNWRMEWVASTLHTTSEHGVSSITTADAHTSAASSRLNWRPPADLNGLVRFAERRNLVSARVPSHFKRSLQLYIFSTYGIPRHPRDGQYTCCNQRQLKKTLHDIAAGVIKTHARAFFLYSVLFYPSKKGGLNSELNTSTLIPTPLSDT